MNNPIYYSGNTLIVDNNNAIVGAAASGFFQALGNLITGASAGTQTLYFLVSTAGQASTIVTYDLIFDGNGHVQYRDENNNLSPLYDAASSNALTVAVIGSMALLGVTLTGAELITAAVGISGLYSVAVDPSSLPYYETVSGTIDEEFKLLDSNGNVVSGVLYKDGLIGGSSSSPSLEMSSAIQALLTNGDVTSSAALQEGMTIAYYDGGVVTETFTLLDGQNIDDLADFMGVTSQTLIGTSSSSTASWVKPVSGELDFNLYFSDAGQSWVIARSVDLLSVNVSGDIINTDYRQFRPSDIFTGQNTQAGNNNNNLIIGLENSNDTLAGGAGNDILFGWTGDDYFFAHGDSSGLDGDEYYGGEYDTSGVNDGIDTVSYAFSSTGVFLNLADGSAQAWNSAGDTFFGNIDRLYSIENAIGSGFDDKIIGSTGDASLYGGNGIDTVDYSNISGGISVTFTAPNDATVIKLATNEIDYLYDIEKIIGSSGDDFFDLTNANSNILIEGGAGSDRYKIIGSDIEKNIVEHDYDSGTDILEIADYRPENTFGEEDENTGVIKITPDPVEGGSGAIIYIPAEFEAIDPDLSGAGSSSYILKEEYIDEGPSPDSTAPLPDWVPDALSPITNTPGVGPTFNLKGWSPLVLDMDGNGQIDLVSKDNSGAFFDFWGDGFAEKVGWIAPMDGLLSSDAANDNLDFRERKKA